MVCFDSGYQGRKLTENIECEIFQTILEEARESYRPEIVHELPSNTPDDMESNICRILDWLKLNNALTNGVPHWVTEDSVTCFTILLLVMAEAVV